MFHSVKGKLRPRSCWLAIAPTLRYVSLSVRAHLNQKDLCIVDSLCTVETLCIVDSLCTVETLCIVDSLCTVETLCIVDSLCTVETFCTVVQWTTLKWTILCVN